MYSCQSIIFVKEVNKFYCYTLINSFYFLLFEYLNGNIIINSIITSNTSNIGEMILYPFDINSRNSCFLFFKGN